MNNETTLKFIVANRAALLAELSCVQTLIRDYSRAVTQHYATGLYLYGPPGTAKTHTVRAALADEIPGRYRYKRGHITPIGLFELLSEHPNEILVLDDMAKIMRSDTALQLLLAALEPAASPGLGRSVEYHRQGSVKECRFRGGIICISNLELHTAEMLDALKSRVNVLGYAPTDAQLGALMLDAADRGWRVGSGTAAIPRAKASEIARFVITELIRNGCRFDLRVLFNKAYPMYLQWQNDETELHWRDLVVAAIKEHLVAIQHTPVVHRTRAERLAAERNVVREIIERYDSRPEQLAAWAQRTRRCARSFLRRRAELTTAETVNLSNCHAPLAEACFDVPRPVTPPGTSS